MIYENISKKYITLVHQSKVSSPEQVALSQSGSSGSLSGVELLLYMSAAVVAVVMGVRRQVFTAGRVRTLYFALIITLIILSPSLKHQHNTISSTRSLQMYRAPLKLVGVT